MLDFFRRNRFAIRLAGSAMAVVGVLGLGFGWGSTAASPAAQPESSSAFFRAFVHAVHNGDRKFLLDRMDPAVIARYSVATCAMYTSTLSDPRISLRLDSVKGPVTFDYSSTGQSKEVPGTYVFTATGTNAGTSGAHVYHFALLHGLYRIFVDCEPGKT